MVQKSWLHEGDTPGRHLYVLAGRQALCFFAKEAPGQPVLSWESFVWQGQPPYLDCLQEATAQSNLCNHQYQQTTLLWQDAPTTLLPARLGAAPAQEAAKALLGPDALGQLAQHSLPPYQLWYRQPADAATALWQTLPLNQTAHLLQHMPEQAVEGLWVDVMGKVASFCASSQGQLKLLVQHRFDTPEDLLYHVLHSLHALDWPVTDTPVALTGLVAEDSSLYSTLHQYLPGLSWLPASAAASDLPAHYFTLYNQC